MFGKIKKCPKCQGEATGSAQDNLYFLSCSECGLKAKFGNNVIESIAYWNNSIFEEKERSK